MQENCQLSIELMRNLVAQSHFLHGGHVRAPTRSFNSAILLSLSHLPILSSFFCWQFSTSLAVAGVFV